MEGVRSTDGASVGAINPGIKENLVKDAAPATDNKNEKSFVKEVLKEREIGKSQGQGI